MKGGGEMDISQKRMSSGKWALTTVLDSIAVRKRRIKLSKLPVHGYQNK